MAQSKDKSANWDKAVGALKDGYGQLNTVTVPRERARLWERIAGAEEAAGRAVDLEVMPALEPREGKSYAEAYAGSARLARILAAGERVSGRYRPGAVSLPGVPRSHRPLWERYLGAPGHSERAALLAELTVLTGEACGTRAASVLDHARASELFLARQAGR